MTPQEKTAQTTVFGQSSYGEINAPNKPLVYDVSAPSDQPMRFPVFVLITLWTVGMFTKTAPAQKCVPPAEPNLISYHTLDVSEELKGPVKIVQRYKNWNIGVSEPDLEEELQFDRTGTEIASKRPHSLPAGPPEELRSEFECDGPRLVKKKFFKKDGAPHYSVTYKYDSSGKVAEIAKLFGDGTLEYRTEYTRDPRGNIVKEIVTTQVHPEHFNPKRYDVYVTTSSTYGYDEKNRVVEEKGFYPSGSLAYAWVYTYDGANRRTRKLWTDAKDRPINLEINTYDDRGLLVEKLEYQNSCYIKFSTPEDPGELCPGSLKTDFGLFNYGTKTVYTYDNHKNWIEQLNLVISENDGKKSFRPSTSESRKIVYYNP